MSLWVEVLRILVRDVLESSGPGSEVRIPIQDKGDLWTGLVTRSNPGRISASALRVVERPRRDQSQ